METQAFDIREIWLLVTLIVAIVLMAIMFLKYQNDLLNKLFPKKYDELFDPFEVPVAKIEGCVHQIPVFRGVFTDWLTRIGYNVKILVYKKYVLISRFGKATILTPQLENFVISENKTAIQLFDKKDNYFLNIYFLEYEKYTQKLEKMFKVLEPEKYGTLKNKNKSNEEETLAQKIDRKIKAEDNEGYI